MEPKPQPHIPRPEDPINVPLAEVLAVLNVLARLERVLTEPGNPIAPQLYGLGRKDADDHLPAIASLPAGPPIIDDTTAHDYVHALRERLRHRRTFLEQLTDPLPSSKNTATDA